MTKIPHTRAKVFQLGFLLLFLVCIAQAVSAQETILKVLVVFGEPGHGSVHLERDGEELFWDPGGSYGTELMECVALSYDGPDSCHRFEGFPWKRIQTERRYDVISDDLADLMRVVSIYHLDGDYRSMIYTYRLDGERGERAWNMIKQGSLQGRKAAFKTNRKPFFCARSVTEYLQILEGPFIGIGRAWTPKGLAKMMARTGAEPSHVYTPQSPEIQAYISDVRRRAGLTPLPVVVSRSPETGG